jgi:hypothetical protein
VDEQQKERHYNLQAGRYDVAVDIGPSYTTQRQEASETMIELLRAFPAAAPIVGDLVASNLDIQGADEIAKRLKALLPPEVLQGESPAIAMMVKQIQQQAQQQQQQMGQVIEILQGQVQDLGQKLQSKEAELAIKADEQERKWAADAEKAKQSDRDLATSLTELELEHQTNVPGALI